MRENLAGIAGEEQQKVELFRREMNRLAANHNGMRGDIDDEVACLDGRIGYTLGSAAQQKISQADAKYQATPKGDLHCDGCVNFQPPNGCKFVQGEISANGWCQLFVPKAKS